MKVRVLSGNLAGTIQDVSELEAEVSIQTGYAEAVTEESSTPFHAEPSVIEPEIESETPPPSSDG